MIEYYKGIELRPIKGFEEYYVGKDGNAYKKVGNEFIKKKSKNNKLISVYNKDKKFTPLSLKKVIAETFLENPKNYDHVIHKDGDYKNTKPCNLEYSSLPYKTIIDRETDQELTMKLGVIKSNCYTKTRSTSYKSYGGKGIEVCSEWTQNRFSFIKWCKKQGYKKGYYLLRINKKGNYCPENCFVSEKPLIGKLNCEMVYDIKKRTEVYKPKKVAEQYQISSERVRQIKRGAKLKHCV